jgi:hypothetical protein
MKPDKNLVDKKGADIKKSDLVETPTPPQHMNPSEKPVKESVNKETREKKRKK